MDRPDAASEVAIVMATFNPDPVLFRAQVDSLRAQTRTSWRCFVRDDASEEGLFSEIERVIGDDPRFCLIRDEAHVGVYRNFERLLALVPPGFAYVALSDQDDRWAPTKLERLTAALTGEVTLAYSDLRVVDRSGAVLAPTFWARRERNSSDMTALLVANSIPGASVLFRSDLIEKALPFPDERPSSFHDHWISSLALATGSLAYVPEPLVDYVQHGNNVIGQPDQRAKPGLQMLRCLRPSWFRRVAADDVSRTAEMAALLVERVGVGLSPDKRSVLERLATLTTGWKGIRWLGRYALSPERSRSTMGLERRLLAGALWGRLRPGPPGAQTRLTR